MLNVTQLIGFGSTPGDPYWNSVVLGLHCNGTNASTTFTDVRGNSVTANGNAQISTAQSKFGGASALFDGTGDYLTIPSSTTFNYGTSDFTIEWWQRWVSIAGIQSIYSRNYDGASISAGGLLVQTGSGTGQYRVIIAGGTVICTESGTPSTGQWYHYAVTRSGTTVRVFRDGTQTATGTDSTDFTCTATLALAGCTAGTFTLNGYIDDLRVTKGVARYTGTFSVPTEAFPEG